MTYNEMKYNCTCGLKVLTKPRTYNAPGILAVSIPNAL